MKYASILFSLFLVSICSQLSFAQTKLIAFKSHSGNMNYYIPELQPEDDFGMPPMVINKIIKLNDSTVVEVSDFSYGGRNRNTGNRDTIVNHPYCSNPDLSLDQLKALYDNRVEFIGFDELRSEKIKKDEEDRNNKDGKTSVLEDEAIETRDLPLKKDKSKQPKETGKACPKPTKENEQTVLPISIPADNSGNGGAMQLLLFLALGYCSVLALLLWKRTEARQQHA